MKERERVVVSGLVTLLLVTWLGFFFHRSPSFAGSLWGGIFAVTGSALMLIPLVYLVIKRVPALKRWVTKWASMRTLLTWHIYAGVLGPILVLVHTGHKFDGTLAVALTAMTLIVVLSGFVGRYLMSYIGKEIRALKQRLKELQTETEHFSAALVADPTTDLGVFQRLRLRLGGFAFTAKETVPGELRALQIADAIADTEYAIASQAKLKSAFGFWLKFHIVLSLVLYALLGFHVWSGLYFGLRWFV